MGDEILKTEQSTIGISEDKIPNNTVLIDTNTKQFKKGKIIISPDAMKLIVKEITERLINYIRDKNMKKELA